MNKMDEHPKRVEIPNEPRIFEHILRSKIRIRILQTLLELIDEMKRKVSEYQNLPGPYLSMIAEKTGLNKRTVFMNLQDLEKEGFVESKHVRYMIGERPMLVRVYLNKSDLDWLRNINVKP